LSEGLQASRNINAVTVETLTFVNYISDIHANPEQHCRLGLRVKFLHAPLNGDSAFYGPNRAGKLGQDAVTRQIDDSTAEPLNNRQDCFSNIP
jgi:hypothetical protein